MMIDTGSIIFPLVEGCSSFMWTFDVSIATDSPVCSPAKFFTYVDYIFYAEAIRKEDSD